MKSQEIRQAETGIASLPGTPVVHLLQTLSNREAEGVVKGLTPEAVVRDKRSIVGFFVNRIDFQTAVNGVQVSQLRRVSQSNYVGIMRLMLEDLVAFYQCKRTLESTYDYEQVISIISKQFWHLKIEEVAYCFSQAKNGSYGRIYDRLTGDIIVDFLKQYDNSPEREAYHVNRNRAYQANEPGEPFVREDGTFDAASFYEQGLKEQAVQAQKIARDKFIQAEAHRQHNQIYRQKIEKQRKARESLYLCLPTQEQESIKKKARHERLVAEGGYIQPKDVPTDQDLQVCQQFIQNVERSIYGN